MLSMRYSQCISNIFDIDDGFGANSTYLGVLLIMFWWDVKFKVVGRVRSEFTLERVSRGFAGRSSDLYPVYVALSSKYDYSYTIIEYY